MRARAKRGVTGGRSAHELYYQRSLPCHDSNRAVGSMLLAVAPVLHPSSSGGSQCPLRMSVHERPLTKRPQAAMPHTAKHSMAATLRPATSRNVLRTWAGSRVRLGDGVFETFHLECPRCRPRSFIYPSIHPSIHPSTHPSFACARCFYVSANGHTWTHSKGWD